LRIRDVYPRSDFYPSRIPDPAIAKKRGEKFVAKLQRISVLFLSLSPNFQKYGFGIRTKPFSDPGVKKAPDPGSESAALSVIVKFFQPNVSKYVFQVSARSFGHIYSNFSTS
jgi:hypothetical protein